MSVNLLLQKADGMFPEGVGGRRAFARDGTAAELTNELLENASKAIEKLWNQRGYDPKKPDTPLVSSAVAAPRCRQPQDAPRWDREIWEAARRACEGAGVVLTAGGVSVPRSVWVSTWTGALRVTLTRGLA